MSRCSNRRGQSLVEVALVLPLIVFGLYIFSHILGLCRNAVKVNYLAYGISRQIALGAPSSEILPMLLNAKLRGSLPPVYGTEHEVVTPWRTLYGISTVDDTGYWMTTTVKAWMPPVWKLGHWLNGTTLEATGLYLREVPVPSQR